MARRSDFEKGLESAEKAIGASQAKKQLQPEPVATVPSENLKTEQPEPKGPGQDEEPI